MTADWRLTRDGYERLSDGRPTGEIGQPEDNDRVLTADGVAQFREGRLSSVDRRMPGRHSTRSSTTPEGGGHL